jgi:flagellar hook-associated protein 1 FlgK
MASLTSALLSSANALNTFSQTFGFIENNITNANTPGYARQDINLQPLPFDPAGGLSGGVNAGSLISSRSEFLEQDVRNQQSLLGSAQQTAGDLGQIQTLFDLTSTSGIASSISNFFNSISQLSVNPNDELSRQSVINQAGTLAQTIQQSAAGIAQVSANVASQTGQAVDQINQIASQIVELNRQYASSSEAGQDAGLDAQMHADLENLSQIANFTVLKNADGGFNVLLGGQTALVAGNTAFPISLASTSNESAILDSQGNDITAQITQGQLGAMIQERNTTLPGYQSSLNTFAQSLADEVNGQLAQGVDANGVAGAPLFSYDTATDAASSFAVTDITPDQIAAAPAGSAGGNGNAVALAQLANAPSINGLTFTAFYADLGAQVGNDVATAQQDQTQAQDQLTQAQTQRTTQSGVSLNDEATQLLQFQQAYQAVGKMVSVLDQLTETVINMVQTP